MYIQAINYEIHDVEGVDDEYGPERRDREDGDDENEPKRREMRRLGHR